ncbi:3-hydroxyacyl-CoA dehydrogenase NAD-binding domain-containing protein [Carnimonas bestiolae]|uniref:3-hydroxyacyl-CoA dehydrogenase NAD-binding domain-containing protein n=1 Tax=Carnimonas bestiolae TaxID=3402172 RepID=UPI003EDB857D
MSDNILKDKHVTVIGGGVIGSSWASLFLANGMQVVISDPADDIEKVAIGHIKQNEPTLIDMGFPAFNYDHLSFEADTEKAVADSHFIQENGPERLDFKAGLWKRIEKAAPESALLLSSSSGIVATKQSKEMSQPERLIIGHPFNPPHLLPLVEVVPGEKTSREVIDKAMAFYSALGKSPLELKREVSGFVANRLQAAIFRECVSLVARGVVSVKDLDQVVTQSLGIRWATGGPFLSFHLGGGDGGFAHFLDQLGPGLEVRWKEFGKHDVSFDESTKETLLKQIEEGYGDRSIKQLADERDVEEISIINALKSLKASK